MLVRLIQAILLVSTTIEANQYNSSFISDIKAEIENTMREELKKEVTELKKTMRTWLDEKETELEETKRELALSVKDSVRDLPYEMFCTYQSSWTVNSIIAYDHFISNYNNAGRPGDRITNSSHYEGHPLLVCVQVVVMGRWTSAQEGSLASPLDTTPSPTLQTPYIMKT